MLLQLPHPILDIRLVVPAANKLQLCHLTIARRHHHQPPLLAHLPIPLKVSSGASVNSVSSPTALSLFFIASSQPLRSANLAMNSFSSGSTSMSSFDSKRIRRGFVSSRYSIIAIVPNPPVVIPLFISAFTTGPRSGRLNNPNWNAAPIQKHTPSNHHLNADT